MTKRRTSIFETTPSDLWAVLAVGAAFIVWTVVHTSMRVVEIVRNSDVPVEVWLDERVGLPIGADGAPVDAEVGAATIEVSDMPAGTLGAAIAHAIGPALAGVAVVVCIMWLCRNLLAGRFFHRTNTRLITAISMAIAVGWIASHLFGLMAANGAMALVADESFMRSVTFEIDFLPILAAMAVAALALVFRTGEKMQRDTEGLV